MIDENDEIWIDEEDGILDAIKSGVREWPQLHMVNSEGKDKVIIYDPKSSIKFIEIKCIDRRVRKFISVDKEVKCLECDHNFGILNNRLYSKKLKRHLCKWRKF